MYVCLHNSACGRSHCTALHCTALTPPLPFPPSPQAPDLTPLLRLAWNKLDPNYLATFMADSAKTFIIGTYVRPPPRRLIGLACLD